MSQRVVVPIEGVYTSFDTTALWHTTEFNGVLCRVLLPSRGTDFGPLTAPYDWYRQAHLDWPDAEWGYINNIGGFGPGTGTIRALGLLLEGDVPLGDELIAFDRAVARWKRLLRDWLGGARRGSDRLP